MAEIKTKLTGASVDDFLNSLPDAQGQDCRTISGIMQKATKAKPEMWGSSIVGFGRYQYKYANGSPGDAMLAAFAPRKSNITVYISSGFDGYDELMSQLGKHGGSKSCIYIKRLSDVHLPTLKKLITESVRHMRKTHPASPAQ